MATRDYWGNWEYTDLEELAMEREYVEGMALDAELAIIDAAKPWERQA